MSNSYNNRRLSIVFLSLLGLVLLTQLFSGGRPTANYRTELVGIDTSQVSQILIYPKSENQEEVKFTKQNGQWQVSKGNITAIPSEGSVENLLQSLTRIKPQRLAAKSSEKWSEYQLTDTMATRVVVQEGEGNTTLDLLVGRFSLKQAPGGPAQFNPQQGQRPQAVTYVRLNGEEEVYATDGFLSMGINRKFDSWRDRSFLQTDPSSLSSIEMRMPPMGTYTLSNTGNQWMIGELATDSATVAKYIGALSNKQGSEFADGFQPSGMPQGEIRLSGTNQQPITIKAWGNPDHWVLESSQNPGVFFKAKLESGLFTDLFKPQDYFFPKPEVEQP